MIFVSKTETVVLNHLLLEDEYRDTIISLRNVPLQNSTEFKLRHWPSIAGMSPQSHCGDEEDGRIGLSS